jgi:hypothetical protein
MTQQHLKKEYDLNIEAQLMHLEKIDAYRDQIQINHNLTIHEFTDALRINQHQQEINTLQERNRLIDTYLTEQWKQKLKLKNSKKKSKI